MLDSFVTHSTIVEFASERVNLGRDDIKENREQVNRMREKLERYIAEHPGFDLVKMLHSGSVAKGTALKTLSVMDVAFTWSQERHRKTRRSSIRGSLSGCALHTRRRTGAISPQNNTA